MDARRIFGVALCGAALAVAAPAQAAFPGANGALAIGPYHPQEPNTLNLVSATGKRTHLSTGAVEFPRHIAWSPDGRRLAFDGPSTSLGTGNALYVMNADGSGLRQVGRGDRLRHDPAWSPDGTRLAFVQDDGAGAGSGDIYTITTAGGSLRQLTTAASWDGEPDWSADGTRIAYTCRSGGRTHICQMSPTGASRSVTTSGLSLTGIREPSWSPDSRSIAFTAGSATSSSLVFRMSRTGGGLRRLTPTDGDRPAWSPDGTRIAFQQYVAEAEPGTFGIRTMRAADGVPGPYLVGTDGTFDLDAGGWQPLR